MSFGLLDRRRTLAQYRLWCRAGFETRNKFKPTKEF